MGDGIPLWYKYRGVFVAGGGFDPNGKNPQKGFVRLSAAVKNVLLDVDLTGDVVEANQPGNANHLNVTAALDMMSKAYSQAAYGAGVVVYYNFGPPGGPLRGDFATTGSPKYTLTVLSNFVKKYYRGSPLGVDTHKFWRHLTIAQSLNQRGFSGRGLSLLGLTGFANSASSQPPLRAGSFLFYENTLAAFEGLSACGRAS